MNRKKIILLTMYPFPHIGGISSVITNYSQWLNSYEIEIISITNSIPKPIRWVTINGPALALNKFCKGFGHLWTNQLYTLFSSIKLAKNYFEKKIIIAHDIPSYRSHFTGKARKILVCHDYYTRDFLLENKELKKTSFCAKYFRTIESATYAEAKEIIAVDNRIKEYIQSLTSSNVITIFNAANTRIFSPQPEKKNIYRNEFKLPVTFSIVLIPRRLVLKNGVEYAIMAAKTVCKKRKCIFAIAGTGREQKNLVKLVRKLGLNNSVLFLGSIEPSRMPRLMNAVDIVLIPSINIGEIEEATSLSAIEAMSCEKVVIASNLGGLKELIADEVNGFLIEERKPQKIAKKVLEVLDNSTLRRKCEKNARKFAITHEAKIKSQILAVMQEQLMDNLT